MENIEKITPAEIWREAKERNGVDFTEWFNNNRNKIFLYKDSESNNESLEDKIEKYLKDHNCEDIVMGLDSNGDFIYAVDIIAAFTKQAVNTKLEEANEKIDDKIEPPFDVFQDLFNAGLKEAKIILNNLKL